MKDIIEKQEDGKISVYIQKEERLQAINNLSDAVKLLAKALSEQVQVNIDGCVVNNSTSNGILIKNIKENNIEKVIKTYTENNNETL